MEEERKARMRPRRLKGHKAAATFCVASSSRPGFVASSGEDGLICFFDLRNKDVAFNKDLNKGPVSSLCFKTGQEDFIYASVGTEIICLDIRMGSQAEPIETYNYNKEEINQIAFSGKSGFLAAADDNGDLKIIDTNRKHMFKSLREAHTSICSSVQFIPWKPWHVITGGLDSKLVYWDFSKGRKLFEINYGRSENLGQSLNPAFIHSIALPQTDSAFNGPHKICAVARGDGIVDLIDLESELRTNLKFKKSEGQSENCRKRICWGHEVGGHTAAVSCVAFSDFGEKGKFVISGGNDSSVKVWSWYNSFDSSQSSLENDLVLSIDVKKKVNWLCTVPTDSENLVVCDTSKVLKVYSI
ncbi:hypothetical protein LUZ60_009357 [Juncus effusus]|nr:hypothetical protein LUZ60_009357 [Juncus effusus]